MDTKEMRERAERWLRPTNHVITRDNALDEDHMALDVLELLDENERLRTTNDHSCTCPHGDAREPLHNHDRACPICVNKIKRIAPEIALDRLAAALHSGDENDELRQQLAAVTAERDSLRAEVERLRESTERGNALLELHQVAREKAGLATAIELLESENNILTGEVMSLASQLDALRMQLAAVLAAKDEACEIALQWAAHLRDLHGDPRDRSRIAVLRSIGKDGGNG